MTGDLILILAYHFPPENAIGAARPFRFYKYLARLGYRCHVITATDVSGCPDLDAETVPDPFVVRPRQGFGWQLERAVRKLLLPGVTGMQWAIYAFRAGTLVIRAQQGSRITILSTFPPLGTHLAAYWLARRHNVRWIADYRDPLADNPVDSGVSRLSKALYHKIERTFVGAADIVIANTDAARDKLIANYPARVGHVHLIWNGFDPEQRLAALPRPERPYSMVSHVGELYGGRNIGPILYSVKRLIEAGRLGAERIRILLVGPMEHSSVPDSAFMRAAEEDGWLSLLPQRVPQPEAQTIIRSSDGLLLIQPQSALQVPGKLFEYLQIGRPILAYVPALSPVERILRKSGVPFECVYPDVGQEEFDASVERFFKLNGVESPPSVWFENEFRADNQARRLSELLRSTQGVLAEGAVAK